jgi:DNA repair photolyase
LARLLQNFGIKVIVVVSSGELFTYNRDFRMMMWGLEALQNYEKQAKVLKRFNPFRSKTCPFRLEVNVYTGCAFQCIYCYARAYIRGFEKPRCKPSFEENLKKDVKKAVEIGLNKLPVSISNSCDPLQPLEDKYGHTLLTVKLLTENGFPIIIVTKNPSKLLESKYLEAMDSKRTLIEVTVINLDSKSFEPNTPPPMERIAAAGELVEVGFNVAIRIDPIIPRFGEILGQSPSEIETLIENIREIGVKLVVAKCLRLVGATAKAHPAFYYGLRPYYKIHGVWTGNCYELRNDVKQILHMPVYSACLKHGIGYSTCLDDVDLPGSTPCDRGNILLCGREKVNSFNF